MGNNLKKNKKNSKKEYNENKREKKVPKKKIEKQENDEDLIKNNPGALVIEEDLPSGKVDLKLLNKQYHSIEKDPIEEIMVPH